MSCRARLPSLRASPAPHRCRPLPSPPPRSAALLAEQQRCSTAEGRLARALENNAALARNNLRLQEQLARLRGEAGVRQHEAGCTRAAAAARDAEAAAALARVQQALQRAAVERDALAKQLAGKLGVISYLEGRLAQAQHGASAAASDACEQTPGSAALLGSGDTVAAGSSTSDGSAGSLVGVGGCKGAAVRPPAGRVSEREMAHEEEASTGSPAAPAIADAAAAAGEEPLPGCTPAQQPLHAGRCAVEREGAPAGWRLPGRFTCTCRPPPSPCPLPRSSSQAPPPATVLRSSLRSRNGVSYAEPSLRSKLRQGDHFTFGAAEAAAAGGTVGRQHGRARTKPRPRFAPPGMGGGSMVALAPVED